MLAHARRMQTYRTMYVKFLHDASMHNRRAARASFDTCGILVNEQERMSEPSPTIEGFRAAFRRPALTFAEIAWRWTIGATTAALFIFYCIEFLDTLPVTNADSVLLSTRQPMLVGKAIAHILRGSLNRAIFAALFAALALCLLWIIAASMGRLATVRALLTYFRREACETSATIVSRSTNEDDVSTKAYDAGKPRPIRALIDLSFLRAAVFLAMILGFAGAAILVSSISSKANPRSGLSVVLFFPVAGLICMAGWALNWWLSMAGIFAARDGEDALAALSAAVTVSRERTASVCAVSIWTGLAHLVAFSIATTAVSLPLAFIRVAPSRIVIAGIILVTLTYFAVADWLYMARLAGYVCIAEMPDALAASAPMPAPQLEPAQATIDRDEPILSDLPNLAVEM